MNYVYIGEIAILIVSVLVIGGLLWTIISDIIDRIKEWNFRKDFKRTLVPIIRNGEMVGYREVFIKIGD